MSVALPTSSRSPSNPVTASSVRDTLAPLGLAIAPEHEAHYTRFLSSLWEVWDAVDAMDDYVPGVDEGRFRREDVHRPSGDENPANAWAWRVTIRDQAPNDGPLKGKTVAIKVSPAPSVARPRDRVLLAASGKRPCSLLPLACGL